MCKYKLGKREGKRPEKKRGMEKEKEEGRERKKERGERERGGGRERKQGYFAHTAHAQYINVHNIMCV